MNKVLLISVLTCMLMPNIWAQNPEFCSEDKVKMKAMKVGVYTRVMQLTSDEAKVFWPMYNSFEKEFDKIKDEQHKLNKEIRTNFVSISDTELEKKLDLIMKLKEQEGALKQKYYIKYKSILPIKKVALIERAEREFKRELLKMYRDKHQE